MDKKAALISIVIPTYKNQGQLQESVESALNQTYPYVEVLVIDDNDPSTEGRIRTEEIMCRYQSDPRVNYIKHTKNKNGAAARNTGIRAAKGDFIAFLDDDDTFLPEKIEKQVAYLSNHPEYDAVYCQVIINGKVSKMIPYEGNALVEVLSERTRMFTSSLMFRRSAIEAIGGFDEHFRRHQDYELMVKFFLNGYSIGCIKEPLVEYCTTGQNMVSGEKLESLKDQFLTQFDDVLNKLDDNKPGLKKRIIASNYAYVFICHIAEHRYKMAFKLMIKYGLISPLGFWGYLLFFIKYHIKK